MGLIANSQASNFEDGRRPFTGFHRWAMFLYRNKGVVGDVGKFIKVDVERVGETDCDILRRAGAYAPCFCVLSRPDQSTQRDDPALPVDRFHA